MDAVLAVQHQSRRLFYHVAERSVTIIAHDLPAADLIERVFAEWHLMPKSASGSGVKGCTISIRTEGRSAAVPSGGQRFAITDNGVCHNIGSASYLEIHESLVMFGLPGPADVEVWINPARVADSQKLIRVVSYALSAALRRCGLFELHSAAVVEPISQKGVLIVGPSGSGKSTLTTQLAAAGWPYLSDDVLVLGDWNQELTAWPVRRCFAVTQDTLSRSQFLQTHVPFAPSASREKARFSPLEVFVSGFRDSCLPGTLFFSRLANSEQSRILPLSAGDMMKRLLRMSPWSCYDQGTAREHLSALAHLVKQCQGFDLFAGRDFLEPDKSARVLASYVH